MEIDMFDTHRVKCLIEELNGYKKRRDNGDLSEKEYERYMRNIHWTMYNHIERNAENLFIFKQEKYNN